MNFFAPSRPRLPDGTPQYTNSQGHPVAALQHLSFCPNEDGTWYVSCFLVIGRNEARLHSCTTADPGELLARYVADPEQVLREDLGWATPSTTLTLEELGL